MAVPAALSCGVQHVPINAKLLTRFRSQNGVVLRRLHADVGLFVEESLFFLVVTSNGGEVRQVSAADRHHCAAEMPRTSPDQRCDDENARGDRDRRQYTHTCNRYSDTPVPGESYNNSSSR